MHALNRKNKATIFNRLQKSQIVTGDERKLLNALFVIAAEHENGVRYDFNVSDNSFETTDVLPLLSNAVHLARGSDMQLSDLFKERSAKITIGSERIGIGTGTKAKDVVFILPHEDIFAKAYYGVVRENKVSSFMKALEKATQVSMGNKSNIDGHISFEQIEAEELAIAV